ATIPRVDLPTVYGQVDVGTVWNVSRPMQRYTRTPRGEVWVAGPDPGYLRNQYNVTVVSQPLPPRLTGRFERDAWRDARRREDQRRAEQHAWPRSRDE